MAMRRKHCALLSKSCRNSSPSARKRPAGNWSRSWRSTISMLLQMSLGAYRQRLEPAGVSIWPVDAEQQMPRPLGPKIAYIEAARVGFGGLRTSGRSRGHWRARPSQLTNKAISRSCRCVRQAHSVGVIGPWCCWGRPARSQTAVEDEDEQEDTDDENPCRPLAPVGALPCRCRADRGPGADGKLHRGTPTPHSSSSSATISSSAGLPGPSGA